MIKKLFHSEFFRLLMLFCLFLFLRFYLLSERLIFEWDQQQFSNQIFDIIVNKKLTLLGPRVISDAGFFLSPYFTYLLLPFYLISSLDPLVLVWFLILVNLIFFITSYLVIKKIFSQKTSYLFLFLWTFSSQLITYDTTAWWPVLIPLGVLLVWYWLAQITKKFLSTKYWVFLGLTLGFFLNMHFQFIFIIIFAFIFLLQLSLSKKNLPKQKIKLFGCLILALGITFLPIILFDLRHNFLNSKLFINFLFHAGVVLDRNQTSFFNWIPVLTNLFQQFLFTKNQLLTIVFYLFIAVLSFEQISTTKKDLFKRYFFTSFLIVWGLMILLFAWYGHRPSEYYFLVFLPFIIILIIDFFKKNKLALIAYLLTYVVINQANSIDRYNRKTYGYKTGLIKKREVVFRIKKIKGPFRIFFNGYPGVDNGFHYLLRWQKIESNEKSKKHLEIYFPEINSKKKESRYYLIKHWQN